MKKLLTFNNDPKLKKRLLQEIKKHEKADAIIKGTYSEGKGKKWRGCAVGCSLRSLNIIKKEDNPTNIHQRYEYELGIPTIIARLEDGIFENIPTEEAKKWPYEFMAAVPVGVDLSMVWPQFAHWLLVDKEFGVLQFAKSTAPKKAIKKVARLYQKQMGGKPVSAAQWRAAATAAAAYAAAYAAYAAAYAAYAAATAAAATAAYAAAYAATAAAYAATAAYAAAAKSKWRLAQRDKLLSLIKECK